MSIQPTGSTAMDAGTDPRAAIPVSDKSQYGGSRFSHRLLARILQASFWAFALLGLFCVTCGLWWTFHTPQPSGAAYLVHVSTSRVTGTAVASEINGTV